MPLTEDEFQTSGCLGLDDPNFDDDLLFDDLDLTKESFEPQPPEAFGSSSQPNYYDDRAHAPNSLVHSTSGSCSRDGKRQRAGRQPEPEMPDIRKTLEALNALAPETRCDDLENAFLTPLTVEVEKQPHQVRSQEMLASSHETLSVKGGERVFTSAPAVRPNVNHAAREIGAGSSASHARCVRFADPIATNADLSTPQAQRRGDKEYHLLHAAGCAPTRSRCGKSPKAQEQVEPQPESYTREHPSVTRETAYTPAMLFDFHKASQVEGYTPHLPGLAGSSTQTPARRERVAQDPPDSSGPTPRHNKRGLAQIEDIGQAAASADESQRPKKRTRTRIEDLEPDAVHVCDFPGCSKKFAKKYNLKIHQKRHSGDLPFICEHPGCSKRFMWLSSFSRHLRVHEARRNGTRRRSRETRVELEEAENFDTTSERDPDIAFGEKYSILSISNVKLVIENERSEDVMFARALSALECKPCDDIIPLASAAQAERQRLLAGARGEELLRDLSVPLDASNPHVQKLAQFVAVSEVPDHLIP